MSSDRALEKPNIIESIVTKKSFWFIFSLLAFALPLYKAVNRKLPEPLPVYYKAPAFSLITEDGMSLKESDMRGKVYLASFFFSNCPTTCPKNLEQIQKIQKRVKGLGDRIALLSFSVDPENDTPKKLFKVAREWKANPFIWKFLTGDLKHIKSTLISGFRVPIGDKSYSNNMYDIAHSEKIVLIDQEGYIRGYYKMEKNDINRLMIDLGLLANNAFRSVDPQSGS